jgi:hypothetical protein
MKLTAATVIRPLANGAIAVYEGTAPAKLVRSTFPCGWLVELRTPPAHDCEDDEGYGCWCSEWGIDGPVIGSCGAPVVQFDNGWACAHGHDHFDYGTYEYYDAEEAEGARKAGVLAGNARLV